MALYMSPSITASPCISVLAGVVGTSSRRLGRPNGGSSMTGKCRCIRQSAIGAFLVAPIIGFEATRLTGRSNGQMTKSLPLAHMIKKVSIATTASLRRNVPPALPYRRSGLVSGGDCRVSGSSFAEQVSRPSMTIARSTPGPGQSVPRPAYWRRYADAPAAARLTGLGVGE